MKKIIIPGVAAAAVIALAVAALPLLISGDMVRTSLLDRARAITGREMQFAGNPKVLFWPFLGVEISDVNFRDDIGGSTAPPILSMPKLKGKLSIPSALQGKVVFSEFQFIRPKFNLKVYSTGQTSWSFPDGKVWGVLEDARKLRDQAAPDGPVDVSQLEDIRLGRFIVEDGIVEFENEITGIAENITNLNGTMDWPTIRSASTFSGRGIWRGDEILLKSSAQLPVMLFAGGSSPITLDVDSNPFVLRFSGEANRLSGIFASGKMSLVTPSLRRLANLFGAELEPGSSLSEFQASGNVSATFEQIEMSDGKFNLDGNVASGTLRLASAETGNLRLSGTLAYDSFDFAPYALGAEMAATGDDGASLIEIASSIEADLRFSAARASIGSLNVTNLAGGVIAKGGKLMFDIGNADLGAGVLVAKLEADEEDGVPVFQGTFNLTGIDLGQFPAFRENSRIYLSGASDLRAKISARGNGFQQLVRNLDGTVNVKMASGKISGLDYPGIIAGLESSNTEAAGSAFANAAAATNVTQLEINANINRGVAWIRNSGFAVAGRPAHLIGKIDLPLGSMALWSYVSDKSATPEQQARPTGLPSDTSRRFFLGGTLTQPLFLPEISEGTIRAGSSAVTPAQESGTPAVNN
jgi:AsmA protein